MQLPSLLQKSGLDRHEVEVYLSLIRMGEGTAGQIAKHSGVPRTYTYRILDDLSEKGFVVTQEHRSVRRYTITDFEAPKRFIEKQQLELYRTHQEAQSIAAQLENLANPQVAAPLAEPLKDQLGKDDFWRLMHSTLTREIWVINPPSWWGDATANPEAAKWEKYRAKQHIWEKRIGRPLTSSEEAPYTETVFKEGEGHPAGACFLIDQYQIQVTSWNPFRALRIESQEMVDMMKAML